MSEASAGYRPDMRFEPRAPFPPPFLAPWTSPAGASADASSARQSENSPNKLLEQQRNEWLDSGATQLGPIFFAAVRIIYRVDGV